MGNFFSVSSILSFLGCVLLGCLYAWTLYGAHKNLPKNVRGWLSAIRVLLVALVAWLLFAPLVKIISYRPEKPIIVIANDNSISVASIKPKGFDQQRYQEDLKKLAAQLDSKYEVKTYSFGDSVKEGLDFSGKGKLSDASALFQQLNDELMNRNVGAVILASDGIFNRGGNPLYDIDKLKAPIYTIALGDTTAKRDILVANVNYNNLVYLDNDFTLDIQLQGYRSKGETAQLSVAENGRTVSQQFIHIDAENYVRDVSIKLRANKVGIQQYTVSLSPIQHEITEKNNVQTIFVEVIDARQKVLLAAAAPHPDLAIFKQAIEEQQHYEATLSLGDELNSVDLQKYSLVILYQLPNINFQANSFLAKLGSAKIATWYVLGVQSNFKGFGQAQAQVSLNPNGNALQEIFPYPAPNFSSFNLDAKALEQLSNYDPLLIPFSSVHVAESFQAALNQRIGKINTQNPLLFFMEEDGRKLGFLIGEGIWKWKLEEAKDEKNLPLVHELISKTVQYLSAKTDKRKFKVYSSKNTFDETENIVLNAALYNEAYEAVNTPDVTVKLKNSDGKVFNYTFSRYGSTYMLNAGTLPQGNYTYIAQTTLGNKKYAATGAFFVQALIAEYQQTTANHQLLYTISGQSGGKMFMPVSVSKIMETIEKSGTAKTISYEDRKYEELINLKWLFVLILVLLTTEWFLRKRNGEI